MHDSVVNRNFTGDGNIAESGIVISRDDDVHAFNGTLERLVKGFLVHLKFKKGAVDLVNDDDRLDTLAKRVRTRDDQKPSKRTVKHECLKHSATELSFSTLIPTYVPNPAR